MARLHREYHRSSRIGWLRAAVLGANDGVISVSSLVVGVAAAGASAGEVLVSGIAGAVAGAMSMAAGEYVSVRSQADTEEADLARERQELASEPERELAELTGIYMSRGLDLLRELVVEAHARDELGITEALRARPLQASLASAGAFAAGAIVPVAAVLLAPHAWMQQVTSATALVTLFVLGALAGQAGGASVAKGGARVAFWGALAMGLTAIVGKLFGAVA